MGKVVTDNRVVQRRRLDEAREKSRLRRRQILCVLVEICARRRADPVRAVAEVHAVQVHAEDLVFGVALLEHDRQDDLLDLARQRFLRREQLDLHQLLRDGAAAFVQPMRRDIDPCGSRRRPGVDRAVVVEVAVLCREHRLGHVRPHLLEGEGDVEVASGTPVFDQLAVVIEHDDVARREDVLAWVRQVLDRPQHVQRRGGKEDSNQGRDPRPLGPHPCEWSKPERTLAAACGRSSGHPSRSSSEHSYGGTKPRLERFDVRTPP